MYMKNFKGMNILVTGGARGIGKAIVERFIRMGARVFFTYNNSSNEAKKIEKEFGSNRVKAFKLNVANYGDAEKLIKAIIKKYGHIDVLINNAGIVKDRPIVEMTQKDFSDVLNTDLTGVFNLSKIIIPFMIQNKKGAIVNISSFSAIKGVSFQCNYSAAKAAVLGFTRSLGKEVARFNITVNSICPGFIKTEMFDNLHPFVKANAVKSIPLGRVGCPEEVAGLAAYLSSNEATYITGQTFIIDGGLSI